MNNQDLQDSEEIHKLNALVNLKQLLLDSLFELTLAINSNFSTDQLLKIYEFILRSQLNIGRIALFNNNGEWQKILSYGFDQELLALGFDVKKELTNGNYETIKNINRSDASLSETIRKFDTIIPVVHENEPLAFALIGKYKQNGEAPEHIIPYIQTITNILIVAIENKRLNNERVKREGVKKELELAAKMQAMLFPTILLQNKNIEMKATYLPHQDIGGDYYDYISISESEFIICIADVSGKGMAAALLMSNFQASMHALLNYTTSLPDLVNQLNNNVNENAKNEKFITLFICKFDLKKNEINYINAGHNPPVLYNGNEVILLSEGTTGLGMFDDLPFINEGRVTIPKGSLLCLYTDGIVEQENDSGNEFGIERISDFIVKNAGMEKMSEFHEKLIDYITAFKQNQPFSDDITLFSCRT